MKSRKFRNNSEGNLLNQYQEKNALLNINQDNPQNKQVLFPNTVDILHNSIHQISTKIEEDKINLRILKERQFKKQSEFNKLAGKPIEKTKEQLLQEVKEKIEKYKNRQIFDPNYGKKEHIILPDEETFLVKKNTNKCKVELDFLRDEINKQILSNLKLSNEIKEVRKDRLRLTEKYTRVEEENKKIQKNLLLIQEKNKRIYDRIHFKDLNNVREQGKILETQFLEKRDMLEYKYHKVIEENIKKEKEHKNDLRKIRFKNAVFADKARTKGTNRSMTAQSINLKLEDEEEFHDRTPILDSLINKWKYVTKYKKNMLNKYIKHSIDLRNSLEKIKIFLGINEIGKLPELIAKDQKQITDIETYLSTLTSEVDSLKAEKLNLKKKIIVLNNSKKTDKEEQVNLVEDMKEKIDILKKSTSKLEQNMERKRNIFRQIQQPTFDFLRKMQKTYLTDFVVSRHNVEENDKLNESNVIDFLETVYCYCQLIKDFDENAKSNVNISTISKESKEINKTLDLLKKDFRMKLSKINYNNVVNNNVQHSIKSVVNRGNDFDETIRRLANEIVDQVTKETNKSFANISSMNTNNASS